MSQSQFLAVMVSISRDRRLNVTVARHAGSTKDEGLLLSRLRNWSRNEMQRFVAKSVADQNLLNALFSELADELSEPESQEV